jgi:hypothetical protein
MRHRLPSQPPPSPRWKEGHQAPPLGQGGPLELLGAAPPQALAGGALEHPPQRHYPEAKPPPHRASSPSLAANQG